MSQAAQAAQVVKFPKKVSNKVAKSNPKLSSTHRRQLKANILSGAAVCVAALTLTGLSLAHLAHGISIVTHASTMEGWAMAVGIDFGFVALEAAKITTIGDKEVAAINKAANPTIVGMMIGSAVLNAFAFSALSEGWMMYPAILMGLAIPAMIYNLTKVGMKKFGCH